VVTLADGSKRETTGNVKKGQQPIEIKLTTP
jgi:hypothetical protein